MNCNTLSQAADCESCSCMVTSAKVPSSVKINNSAANTSNNSSECVSANEEHTESIGKARAQHQCNIRAASRKRCGHEQGHGIISVKKCKKENGVSKVGKALKAVGMPKGRASIKVKGSPAKQTPAKRKSSKLEIKRQEKKMKPLELRHALRD